MYPVRFAVICGFFALFLFAGIAQADQIEYLTPRPLAERISVQLQPVREGGEMPLYVIMWGADVGTVFSQEEGIFKKHGFNFKLVAEDKFQEQVESCLRGDTFALRGTVAMVAPASEVFKRHGVTLRVVHQLSWSVGSDMMVARQNIRSAKDLRGKTIALQLDGPHMDYVANILETAGVPLSSVKFKFLQEITLPKFDTGGKIIDPVSAFQADQSVDAVMCVDVDGLLLTSNGKVGSGSEGSVKGAHILVDSKRASRIIADVYAVRSDFADANPERVKAFAKALSEGQGQWTAMMRTKPTKYRQIVSAAANLIMGSSTAVNDIEGMLGGCEFVGPAGNLAFFTGKGTSRNLANLTSEIQPALQKMGLMTGSAALSGPTWDVAALLGLPAGAVEVQSTAPRVDQHKVAAKIERQIEAEPDTWEAEGTLFEKEILFDREQSDFSETRYAEDFMKAFRSIETYGGALVTVEGHVDVKGLIKAREKAAATKLPVDIAMVSAVEGRGKTLSHQRADEVKKSFLAFCRGKGYKLDEAQFIVIGMGAKSPKVSDPSTPEESAKNRRVVFRIKGVEVE